LIEIPFEEELQRYFNESLGRRSSVLLFGSAATGHFVSGRSDLDLAITIKCEQLGLLGDALRAWDAAEPRLPIIGGYAVVDHGGYIETFNLELFLKTYFPRNSPIEVVDRWLIRNRFLNLWGDNFASNLIEETTIEDLKGYALRHIQDFAQQGIHANVPAAGLKLSDLIWSASWTARMLMLVEGEVCESKRAALEWLAKEEPAVGEQVGVLLKYFDTPDQDSPLLPHQESLVIITACRDLITQAATSMMQRS
jgi:predicted nucleotidyltransferase